MGKDRENEEWNDSIGQEPEQNGFSFDEEKGFEFDDEEGLASYLSDAVAEVTGEKVAIDEETKTKKEIGRWGIRKKCFVGLGTTLGCLVLAFVLAFGWVLFRIGDEGGVRAASDLTEEERAAQATIPPWNEDQALLDGDVVNILLIGREGINDGDDAYGRSDSMIIASMNTEKKTVKMVSIMRDCYVYINGYRENKLNAAYSYGGGELLKQTIETNFGIPIAGYVVVDFAAFEEVINSVGGVDISLTETEAEYLNTTNYISKKKYRTVVPGTQTVNGNQALGYCRVRHVAAINGENDDYGRTYRQRAVLSQIYSKVMTELSATEAVNLAYDLLDYVATDISSGDLITYAKCVLSMGIDPSKLEQMRIPMNNSFTSRTLHCGSSLCLDWTVNQKELWNFLYGTEEREVYTLTPDSYSSSYTSSTYTPATDNSNASTTTYAPIVTSAPTQYQTEEPIQVTQKPVVVTEAPVITEAPVVTEAPVITEAPVVTEVPVVVTEPPAVATEVPQQPVSNEGEDSVG